MRRRGGGNSADGYGLLAGYGQDVHGVWNCLINRCDRMNSSIETQVAGSVSQNLGVADVDSIEILGKLWLCF